MRAIVHFFFLLFSGNFDRFSATRRTRRYKKTQDTAGDREKSDASSPELIYDEKPTQMQRPSTLALNNNEETRSNVRDENEDTMLRVWQDKLKRRDTTTSLLSRDIDAALAEIARSGEDLQRLSHQTPVSAGTTNAQHRTSRLPVVSQPPPVVAVTNTVLSPVMQESRPREPVTVFTERAVTSREQSRSMIDPSQVKELVRVTSNPPSQVNQEQEQSSRNFPRNGSSLLIDRKHVEQNDTSDVSMTNIAENEKCANLKCIDVVKNDTKTNRRSADEPDHSVVTRQNSSSLFRNRYIPDINVTQSSPFGKSRDQELNDEGFEETQSLVSETLSQETSSGNYETDTHDSSTRCSPAELLGGYNSALQHRRNIGAMDEDDDLSGGRRLSVNRSLKSSTNKVFDKKETTRNNASEKSSFLPKRTASMKRETAVKKTELKRPTSVASSNSAIALRGEVQRSGSRSSLRSSRSSLNSATSVNTVRNLATNHAHLRSYTSAIRALTNDLRKSSSPLPPKDAVDNKRRPNPRQASVSRIPASRSSSSGSSVGPAAARSVRKITEVSLGNIFLFIEFNYFK